MLLTRAKGLIPCQAFSLKQRLANANRCGTVAVRNMRLAGIALKKTGLQLLLVRIFLGSVFAGAVSAMLFSLAGGLLCYLVILFLRRLVTEKQI